MTNEMTRNRNLGKEWTQKESKEKKELMECKREDPADSTMKMPLSPRALDHAPPEDGEATRSGECSQRGSKWTSRALHGRMCDSRSRSRACSAIMRV